MSHPAAVVFACPACGRACSALWSSQHHRGLLGPDEIAQAYAGPDAGGELAGVSRVVSMLVDGAHA